MHRSTGGNRFISHDADCGDLARAIERGLLELRDWAADTGRVFDAGAISVETKRIPSGAISVTVTGDLIDPTTTEPEGGER
jgi:hypothetical protein